MNLLVQWVTQILIFLLLATIVDLIIPNTSMKKYIKLVVGLIFLLIFLQPLFYLVTVDGTKRVEDYIVQQLTQTETSTSLENSLNLQKKEIQASQRAYILEQTENHLIDLANDSMQNHFQLSVSKIQFTFLEENAEDYENLEQIEVYLTELENKKGDVDAVDEIVINMDENESERYTDMPFQHEDDIKSLLANVWEVSPDLIILNLKGGTY